MISDMLKNAKKLTKIYGHFNDLSLINVYMFDFSLATSASLASIFNFRYPYLDTYRLIQVHTAAYSLTIYYFSRM